MSGETTMVAYHNRPDLKAAVLTQLAEHRRMDRPRAQERARQADVLIALLEAA